MFDAGVLFLGILCMFEWINNVCNTFDVLVRCRGNFCIFIFMIPYWWMFTFETSCIQINAVYLGMIHGEPKTLTLADLCVHYQIPTSLQWLQPFCKYNNLIPRPHHKINHNIIAQLLYMSSYQICIHTTQTFQKWTENYKLVLMLIQCVGHPK